jgi:very-short-patch-repair endonuclease
VTQARTPAFDEMDQLQMLLFRQDQVISRRQALLHLSQSAIRHRLETGRWRVAERGVYLTHTGPVSHDQRLMIASLAVGAGRPALIAGVTALTRMGLRGYHGDTVHVLLSWRRRDRKPPHWVAVHRTRHLSMSDVHARAAPPYTLPARSLVDAAQWARTDDDAVALVAAGFQQRLVAGDEVRRALARMPLARRNGLILAAAADAAGGSHSLPEVEFLRGCRRAKLPQPSRQVARTDPAGRQRYLDAYFPEYGVQVEIDGGHHLDPRHWWADMRRQNGLWVAGDRVLRFPAFLIRTRPDEWVPQLRAALVAGGWPAPS